MAARTRKNDVIKLNNVTDVDTDDELLCTDTCVKDGRESKKKQTPKHKRKLKFLLRQNEITSPETPEQIYWSPEAVQEGLCVSIFINMTLHTSR